MNRMHVIVTVVCVVFLLSLVLIPSNVHAATVPATTGNGTTVYLTINGNISNLQMTNAAISNNKSAATATISFTLIGASGTTGFSNITIPKSAVSYGNKPSLSIDGKSTSSQGFAQDSNNYYVWYTTSFSNNGVSAGFGSHSVSIVFSSTSPSPSPTVPEFPAQLLAITLLASMVAVLFGITIAKRKILGKPIIVKKV